MHWLLIRSEGLWRFDCVELMVDTHRGLTWTLRVAPPHTHAHTHSLENLWHRTGHRLRSNVTRYNISSTGLTPLTGLFLFCVYTSFFKLCSLPRHPSPSDSSLHSASLPPFFFSSFLNLNSALRFQGGGLAFVLLCNEQMLAVNVFPALCQWDCCQTEQDGGGTHCISLFYSWRPQMFSMLRKKEGNTGIPFSRTFFLSLTILISSVTIFCYSSDLVHVWLTSFSTITHTNIARWHHPTLPLFISDELSMTKTSRVKMSKTRGVMQACATFFFLLPSRLPTFIHHFLFFSCAHSSSAMFILLFFFSYPPLHTSLVCPSPSWLSSPPSYPSFPLLHEIANLSPNFPAPSTGFRLATLLYLMYAPPRTLFFTLFRIFLTYVFPPLFLQALVALTVVSTVRSPFGPWGPQSTT